MSGAHRDEEPWRAHLVRTDALLAEGAIDAAVLELAIVLDLLRTRGWIEGREGFSSLEFQVVEKACVLLRRRSRYDDMLRVADVGRAFSQLAADRYGVVHFTLHGVEACVALLDFRSARLALCAAVGCEGATLDDPAAFVDAVASLEPAYASVEAVRTLRLRALLVASRYLAAIGALGHAEVILESISRSLEGRPSPLFDAIEVKLRCVEVRIDRGDIFGAMESLDRQTWPHPVASSKAAVLRSEIFHLQGRYGRVERLLRDLLARADIAVPVDCLAAARWLRAHALAALNRLDEAGVSAMDADPTLFDVAAFQDLLTARRESAKRAVPMAPSVFEMLEPAGTLGESGLPSAPYQDDNRLVRTRERARSDFARLYNATLMALHRGDVEETHRIAGALREWVRGLDSALLRSRSELLMALVDYHEGRWPDAEGAALRAADAATLMGLLPDEWTARTVRDWCFRRLGVTGGALHSNHERLSEIQRRVISELDPVDAAQYLLNKWDKMDQQVADVLDGLSQDLDLENVAGTRSVSARRRSARVRRGLRDVLTRRRSPSRPSRATVERPYPSCQIEGRDVYTLALSRSRSRQADRTRLGSLHAVRNRWLPADTAVLHYVVLPDRTETFLLTRKMCALVSAERRTTRPELWSLTRTVLGVLRGSARWPGEAEPLFDLSTRLSLPALFDLLPEDVKHLAIVPDDVIAHIPFAALPVKGVPCVQRCSLSFVPGLGWLIGYFRRPRRYRRGLGVEILGADLETAEGEIEAFASSCERRPRILRDEDATRAAVFEHLPGVEALHFACHGSFIPAAPNRSGLLMHDGCLTLSDIESLDLRGLGLAFLASCWGADAATLPGGVHVGLPYGFLESGADVVIACLWQAKNDMAVRFAQHFYAAAAANGSVDGLAEVQRAWCNSASPADWAGYVAFCRGLPARITAWPLVGALWAMSHLLWRFRRHDERHRHAT